MNSFLTIILAAGKGKRMESELPKVLLPVGDKPMVDYVIKNAIDAGTEKIILVVGYRKELVVEHVGDSGNIIFVTQSEQLGTGHAVMQARKELENYDGNVLILYGDMPFIKSSTIRAIVDKHTTENADMTLLTVKGDEPINGFGRILRDAEGNLVKIIEQKDATVAEKEIKEVNPSVFMFKKEALFFALDQIKNNNAQSEYYLTDCLEILLKNNKKVSSITISDVTEVAGANTPEELEKLNKLLK